MERGKKEAIIYKKLDRYGKEITIPIYMIDESLAKDFKYLVKKKEEYQNSSFVKKVLPKDLFEQVESRSSLYQNPTEQFKYEKELQFQIHKFEFDPFILRKNIDTLKII